jgi:hypothetical protein
VKGAVAAKVARAYSGSAGAHTGAHDGIPGVTTLSRRALLCLRGGFLPRRRSGSRSSQGPGSYVGRAADTSLRGWCGGCSRCRRLLARLKTTRVNWR